MLHFAIRLLAQSLRLLPFPLLTWLARRVGDVLYFVMPSRRRIALRNLDIAFHDSLTSKKKKQIARRAFQSTALSVLELFLIPKILKEVHSRFRLFNRQILEDAFRKEKGVILAVSHLGSWEYLSFIAYLTKVHVSVVVRDIRDPYFDREVNSLRRITTVNPIPKKGSIKEVIRKLKQNHVVAILIDQWAGQEGIWQDFFSRATSTTSIPARLALRHGSPIVPAYCLRTAAGCYDIEIHAPVSTEGGDEMEITRRLGLLLEEQIKKYPDQWLWTHRRWKPKPDTNRA